MRNPWALGFAIFNALDLALTAFALRATHLTEQNPIVRSVIDNLGMPWLAVLKALGLAAVVMLAARDPRYRWLLPACTLILALVCISNAAAIRWAL